MAEVIVTDQNKGARKIEISFGDAKLVNSTPNKTHNLQCTTLDQLIPSSIKETGVVLINDRNGTLLSRLKDETFETLKSVVSANLPIVWLTRGIRHGASIYEAMIGGFLRVIRSEQASARIVLLDVDLVEQPVDVVEAILSISLDVPTKDSGKDTEFWQHRGRMYIPRVYSNTELNTAWPSSSALTS
ncbi:uncharacterized protein ATNIH1004_004524 [Aspergillus tanneri]|nr:uncharacterized protein ATNIH1004_004524 [Aspergillus tanneri]KAA8648639.1 hypothetical protein ATNIH1004_004524 [Aspergillus tanneri]